MSTPFLSLSRSRGSLSPPKLPDVGKRSPRSRSGRATAALPQHIGRDHRIFPTKSLAAGRRGRTGPSSASTSTRPAARRSRMRTSSALRIPSLARSPATVRRVHPFTRAPGARGNGYGTEATVLGDSWRIAGGCGSPTASGSEATRFGDAPAYEWGASIRCSRVRTDSRSTTCSCCRALASPGVGRRREGVSTHPPRLTSERHARVSQPPRPSFIARRWAPPAPECSDRPVFVGPAVRPRFGRATRRTRPASRRNARRSPSTAAVTSRPAVVVFDPRSPTPQSVDARHWGSSGSCGPVR